jgi:hypothetical protein
MKEANSQDLVLKKMIEETYKSLPERDVTKGPEDLLSYFIECESVDNSKKIELEHYQDFYRLNVGVKVLDFPKNFSIFSNPNITSVNLENDHDFLLEILGLFLGRKLKRLTLEQGDKESTKYIELFFEEKKEKQAA